MVASTSSPADVSSIVPGSIFQDDTPSPSFVDGLEYEPPQVGSSPSVGSPGIRGWPVSSNQQIEVSSTIQTVLIALGVCVGALVLLGVFATHYISHKNKIAKEKKKALGEKGGMFSDGDEGDLGRLKGDRSGFEQILIDEKDGGDLIGPAQPPKSKLKGSIGSSSNTPPPSSHSLKSSIIGGIGRAVGSGGHSGTGSFQIGASGSNDPANADPRNSFMEVPQVSARRPSIIPTPIPPTTMPTTAYISLRTATSDYSPLEHPRHAGVPPEPQLGSSLYQDNTLGYNISQDLSSPLFAISPSSIGTNEAMEKNPFASPSLSADFKTSSLQDPFQSQNNNRLSLNITAVTEDNANGTRDAENNDPHPFPLVSADSPGFNSSTNTFGAIDRLDYRSNSGSSSSILSPPSTQINPFSPETPVHSLGDLSGPKHVLCQFQSAVPTYHHHIRVSASPTGLAVNIFESYGHGAGSPATRPKLERQVGYSPGVVQDHRSIADSIVTPENGGSHLISGSINEGNAWYHKRASVIIPEGGTAHVELWKDEESSGTQSSSQSRISHSVTISAPPPLRMDQQVVAARDGIAVFEGKSRVPSRSPSPPQGVARR
ncbi:hypothetical protein BGZ46_007382 [Entomortierella lignicola]|nr:hypothetical protein BGZ46_007382 [Entomortierella lignicola]